MNQFGKEWDEQAQDASLRAQLCAVVSQACMQHSARIVDLILRDFAVRARWPIPSGWPPAKERPDG